MSDLQILFPKPVTVTVGGRQVLIRPVELRHFDEFGKAAGGLLAMLGAASPAQIYEYAKSSGALSTVLGGCTNLSAWRRQRLPAVTAVELMIHVIGVNSSFFDQALARVATNGPLAGQVS
ncbi:hypothetical protein NK553_18420 [Pseudomonas sp. ZM23]|uniref:Uncharacterized protein n=1 Tax=Pseudomonas triclosanedens TaxID=2961893 RepID=A0ABY6ZTX0_9PSED|nr:hypothetical protein [Pseudomonas triclosanedens]MCP8465930.1 hypothetical protein [Pseudomonas triclosanedens]MCP8472251.1 hypothetical protein [Pseudomonas triclosanedens]MCP8477229.1 hypothetical protein [Pseudomonas triclosanedens]WAI47433.1 hypothetical protein OU419_16795 [Pseudomonas triclosanedens]